ncbi:amidohydrolase [Erysipelothrix urinaevulpis]|uniref:amidohydrolase n=1 Tax=Erysipelothrix urinaevulpis TaxID=2683717 RepID=UPI001359915B|nr:amidohydrolase [Erysipelothrix urinaevulpis]
MNNLTQWIESQSLRHLEKITQLSDTIWSLKEVKFETQESAKLMANTLEEQGFSIEFGVAGLQSAFVASYGEFGPTVGFLAEYDALEGVGHACGHNLLGSGSTLAAILCKEYQQETHKPFQIKLFGCPAEESGYGKSIMAAAGVFDDVDIMLTWHPNNFTQIWADETLAVRQAEFEFKGIASHAAGAPELGRSALDACELMNVGVNYLREHVLPSVRMHYAYLDAGGPSANVVQETAKLYYFIRDETLAGVNEVLERVEKIAQGAALMTETTLDIHYDGLCKSYHANQELSKLLHESLVALGPIDYGDQSSDYDSKILEPIFEQKGMVSTDVGDVSWITPTAQAFIACEPIKYPMHSIQWTENGTTKIAHLGIKKAGEALALTAIKVMNDSSLLESIQASFKGE